MAYLFAFVSFKICNSRMFFFFLFFNNLKNNSDCVPFDEGLTEQQEEEQPKTLLEVSEQLLIMNMAVILSSVTNMGLIVCSSCHCFQSSDASG